MALAPAAAGAEPPGPAGEWDGPLGRVRIRWEGDGYRGTLVAPSSRCRFRAGEEVLRGTLVDDSLAGLLRVCLAGKGCPAEEWASALFLVRQRSLSGAVHVREKACRAPVGKRGGVTMARATPNSTSTPTTDPLPAHPEPFDSAQGKLREAPSPSNGRAESKERERARAILRDGAAWLREGAFEEARARFLEALEVDATIPEAYNGVGVTYRMRNDLEEALEWYKKALSIDPDFGDAYYNMACVYALRGEKTLALRYLQIAAVNGYVTAEGVDGDSDLASLRATREYRALRDRM